LLGIVEGLTEFLPVSSTAHLRITEALMKIPLDDAYWKMYTIVIQLGAILALMLLFLSRIVDFIRTFPQGENRDRTWLNHPISLTLIAFAFTSAPALLLHKWSEKNLGSLKVMALALLIGGIVMWIVDVWSDRYEAGTNHVEEMTLPQAIWIGLCQTLSAVFPGTSRSMSTIAAGQIAGMDRPTALEFSFLLSIPTMIAATIWDLKKEVFPSHGVAAHVVMNGENWIVLIIGFVVSFIVALGVVEWFLFWVRKHGFTIFAIYRILLGAALLIWGSKFIGG
jgi:undecaprenyl-diphosphatase